MPEQKYRYRFVIEESFTPDTLPMRHLAGYMSDLADLLGEEPSVHFVQIASGSTVLVQDVDRAAYPKVRKRVHAVKRGDAAPDAQRAYDSLDRRLAADNASGALIEEQTASQTPARVLEFPGKRKVVELEYGPITQAGSLQGAVIVVGGESDPVPVHLQDGDTVHICRARRQVAKELAEHIFGCTVRVSGNGRWLRDSTGVWVMRSFQIMSFAVLEDSALSTVVAKLRQIPGKWKEKPDSTRVLHALRTGDA
jgi:hypothetical protein